MPEPIDAMGPWTIKSVPTSTKEAVIKAARQEGLTVGQWLERRVQEWTDDGSPVRQGAASYPVSDIVNLGQVAVALASAPEIPVVKTARIIVRAALLGTRGHTGLLTGPAPPSAPPTSRPAPE